MTRIGLLSDTHGHLNEAIFEHFSVCDEIWHAGDFGNEEVINKLENFRPLKGVYGNIDGAIIRQQFPERLFFQCEEVKVFMMHIGGYPGRYVAEAKKEIIQTKPQLFISGHSHILKIIFDEQLQCLHMNPGAAGKQGWHKVCTLIRFEVNGDKMQHCEVIEMKR